MVEFSPRDQLQANSRKGEFYLNIDLEDLTAFDDKLASGIRTCPNSYLSLVSEKDNIGA